MFYFCLKSTTFIVALGERHYYLHRRYKTIWLNVIFSRKYRVHSSSVVALLCVAFCLQHLDTSLRSACSGINEFKSSQQFNIYIMNITYCFLVHFPFVNCLEKASIFLSFKSTAYLHLEIPGKESRDQN